MRFSGKEDIEAPIDEVFAAVTDFSTFERAALRRGADVRRTDSLGAPGVGMSWDIGFSFRGKPRLLVAEMTSYEEPSELAFASRVGGLDVFLTVDLLALSRKRTRLAVVTDLKPKTLSARLLVQSMRLGKTRLNARYKGRLADFAADFEDRVRRPA